MKERLEDLLAKVKETTQNLSSKTKKIIIIGLVLSVLASIGFAIMLNNKPYEVLFANLNAQEATEIMGKLQEKGVPYKYETNGTILVPKEQEAQLKADLVYEGYPKSGFTYNIFKDNISLTTSESEKEQYARFDLQERMGATISLFPDIKEAKVTIAPGEETRYVLDAKNEAKASASVTLETESGEQIDEESVRAIQRLISKSIPKVDFSNVGVICNGKDVTISDEKSQVNTNELKFRIEQIIDEKIEKKVLDVLVPIYGEKKVKVSVRSEVDINKKIREMTNYSGEDGTNRGVISNQQGSQEINKNGEGQAGGVPGTETNSDFPIYQRVEIDGTETYILTQGNANYLVDQVKEQEQVDAGDLKDLSIAVLIDGNDLGNVTIEDITTLVAKAAGISPEQQDVKIKVLSTPFYTDEPVEDNVNDQADGFDIKKFLPIVGIILAILLLLIIVLFILLKKRKKKKLAASTSSVDPTGSSGRNIVLPERQGLDIDSDLVSDLIDIRNEKALELKDKIRNITEENPEIAAQIIKSWIRGGEREDE